MFLFLDSVRPIFCSVPLFGAPAADREELHHLATVVLIGVGAEGLRLRVDRREEHAHRWREGDLTQNVKEVSECLMFM